MDEPDNRLQPNEANKIIFTYGGIAAITYIIYFLIMKAAGLIQHTEFRYLNYVLYGVVGFFALRNAREKAGGNMSYLQGMGISVLTSAVSFLMLAVFVFIFAKLNPGFLTTVLKETPSALETFHDPAFTAAFIITAEGVTFGVIISLCLMQYFQRP